MMSDRPRDEPIAVRCRHVLLNEPRRRLGEHNRLLVVSIALQRQRERRPRSRGPANVALEDAALLRRPHRGKRVAGFERRSSKERGEGAVILLFT